MRVLITGCAGFIGAVLTKDLLSKGYIVYGLDKLLYGNSGLMCNLGHPNFKFEQHDVRNPHKFYKEADIIIPLAALVGAPICQKKKDFAFSTNEQAIQDLVNCWTSKSQRILFPNSNSGYGVTDGKGECTEESEMKPISLYAQTKCNAEKYVLQRENSTVFRLATVFGCSPRMRLDLMVNNFIETFFDIQSMSLYEPHFKRNFVHILDVVQAFHWAIQNDKRSGVFNLGNPDCNMSKWQLAKLVMEKVQEKTHIQNFSLLSQPGQDPDQRNYLVSSEKIQKLGFKFEHSLESGVNQVIEFCQYVPKNERSSMRNY